MMALLSDIDLCISAKNVLWNDADSILLKLFIKVLKYILSAKYVLSYNFRKKNCGLIVLGIVTSMALAQYITEVCC